MTDKSIVRKPFNHRPPEGDLHSELAIFQSVCSSLTH